MIDTAHISSSVGRANKDAVLYIISLGHRDMGRRCGAELCPFFENSVY